MKLLIDGYNVLKSASRFKEDLMDIKDARSMFICELVTYKSFKGHSVHVVFDGWDSGYPLEKIENFRGIHITFSRIGENADSVIKRFLSSKSEEMVVITSDLDIARFAKQMGYPVVSSKEFDNKLLMMQYTLMKGTSPEEEDELYSENPKKGNPRRLSKIERKRQARLKKL